MRVVYVNSQLPSNGYRDSNYQKYLLHPFLWFLFSMSNNNLPYKPRIRNNTSNKENLYTGGFALCLGKHWLGRGSRLSFCLHILSFRILYMDKATFAIWLQTTYASSHSKTTRSTNQTNKIHDFSIQLLKFQKYDSLDSHDILIYFILSF